MNCFEPVLRGCLKTAIKDDISAVPETNNGKNKRRNTGILHSVQDDDVKQTRADTRILRFIQDGDVQQATDDDVLSMLVRILSPTLRGETAQDGAPDRWCWIGRQLRSGFGIHHVIVGMAARSAPSAKINRDFKGEMSAPCRVPGCGRIVHLATMELFNTLGGKIETLTPVGGPALRMYCCGPTVYDYGHIGNFRTFLHVDVLRRFVRQQGMKVEHVMNVTDVDDKIIRNAAAAGVPIAEYTAKFERAFFEDSDALGIQRAEQVAYATAAIPDMVELIQKLAAKDIAYQAEDGSWYFRIHRFPEYGKLSRKDFEGIEDGARVDVDEYEKDAARDFALWKAVKPGEQSWETALGSGRPGWHIECSAMAMKFLGESIDLHAGGEDLMFPHHENEIAQSESATGHTFARHWMHVRFLLVEGRKMSKSEGNFYTLRDLLLKGYRASAIRFLLISVPYRNQMNFTFESLTESTNAVDRLRTFHQRMLKGGFADGLNPEISAATAKASAGYTAALANDLNTAEARAAIFDLVRAANSAADAGTLRAGNVEEILKVLALFDGVFAVLEDNDAAVTRAALAWAEAEGRIGEADPSLVATLALSDADIDALVAERTQAKKTRNFARADAIRNDLLAKGILIEDAKDGVRWKRK